MLTPPSAHFKFNITLRTTLYHPSLLPHFELFNTPYPHIMNNFQVPSPATFKNGIALNQSDYFRPALGINNNVLILSKACCTNLIMEWSKQKRSPELTDALGIMLLIICNYIVDCVWLYCRRNKVNKLTPNPPSSCRVQKIKLGIQSLCFVDTS